MASFTRKSHVKTQTTEATEVLTTFVSALMETVKAEAQLTLQPCPVYFRDLQGREHEFRGINYLEAVVQSPLVEEGSGQLLCHPQSTRTFAVRTKVRTNLPGNRLGEESLRSKIRVAGAPLGGEWKNQTVGYGQSVISMVTPKGEGFTTRVIEKWGEVMPGIIKDVQTHWDDQSQLLTVSVECLAVMSGDNEKYRGFGKARGNGGFLRNIKVTQTGTGKTVFDPQSDLKIQGNYVQVEHVVGAEEYKVLNYLIGMLAHEMDRIVWNSLTGKWEGFKSGQKLDEKDLLDLLGRKAKRVEVTRKWLDGQVYSMLKRLYGPGGKDYAEGEFSFNDETRSITHHAAPAWIGLQTQIIEVPMTLSFMGKTSMFAEHISYLGTEFPSLRKELLQSVKRNSVHLERLFDMAMGVIPGATEDNPTGEALVLDEASLIAHGDKWAMKSLVTETGGKVVETLTIPSQCQYDTEFARTLGKKLSKIGYPALVFEAANSSGEIGATCLYLQGFVNMTGEVAHKAFKNFSLLLQLLEEPADERDHKWDAEYYRLVRMLQGAMEFLVADSNALLAKAAKTEKCLLTSRRMGTVDGSVGWGEIHAHPAFLALYGLQPHYEVRYKEDGSSYQTDHNPKGDWAVNGRVPVPGSSTQKWVANSRVPFGVVCQNAALVHYQDNGDHDGDSGVTIVLDHKGKLKPVKAGINVNPIA